MAFRRKRPIRKSRRRRVIKKRSPRAPKIGFRM